MTRNELKNTAETLCHMFCGWRQIFSKSRLVELGSGTLEVDVLAGECFFDGKHIPILPIAKELRGCLHRAQAANSFRQSVLRARLRVGLSFSTIPWNERTRPKEIFYVHGQPIRTAQMHRCKFVCDSEIVEGPRTHRSNYTAIEEWPTGWPSD